MEHMILRFIWFKDMDVFFLTCAPKAMAIGRLKMVYVEIGLGFNQSVGDTPF